MKTDLVRVKPSKDLDRDFVKLVGRCLNEDPDKKDLTELEDLLEENPQLGREILDLNHATRQKLIKAFVTQDAVILGVEKNMTAIENDLGYQGSPALEKMLIENVVNSWLRLQYVECKLSGLAGEDAVSFVILEFWDKRLNAAQRRFLRASETLMRIRKITNSMTQVNIAADGGQQVNIGQVVKGE